MDDEPVNRRWITPAQWMAARAIAEGAHPTRKRVAAVLGCDDSAVYARAAVEGWTRLDFRSVAVRELHDEMIDAAAARAGREPPGAGADDGGDEDEDEDGDRGRSKRADGGSRVGGALAGGFPSGGIMAQAEDDAAGDADPVSMLATASRFVSRQLARLMARADRRGGRLDKRDVDGLAALARMMERWESLATERAKEEETESDDEIAELLAKINDRIGELARAEAARIVAAGHRPEAGPARA